MGSCENMAHRRTTQDHLHPVRIDNTKCDVASAASNQMVRVRTLRLFNVGIEPFLYAFLIDALHSQ